MKKPLKNLFILIASGILFVGCAHDHNQGGTGTPSGTSTGSGAQPHYTTTNDMDDLGYAPVAPNPLHTPSNQTPSGARRVPGRSVFIDTY